MTRSQFLTSVQGAFSWIQRCYTISLPGDEVLHGNAQGTSNVFPPDCFHAMVDNVLK